AMMIVAHADLCRFYNLPCRSGGALTDAHGVDAQAAYESMMSLLTTANSGVDFVLHAGGILSSYLAFSFEKFVLDEEICSMVRRFQRGIVVEPDTLAYDVIARVGSGGNYLMENHTLERYRNEFWLPSVFSRMGIEKWQQAGRPDVTQRAGRYWKELVAEHQDPPLDGDIARQLQKYVESKTS
ncbi:MAG: trimethylamine methyltransferase family protein, partial [Anaerolineales bacterium]|nr:trimethylamine methyltransferase family protein [Anaerolineales bacterium]